MLAVAGTFAVVVGGMIGQALVVREPVATTRPANVAKAELVTNTIDSRWLPAQSSSPIATFPKTASPAASTTGHANATAAPSSACSRLSAPARPASRLR